MSEPTPADLGPFAAFVRLAGTMSRQLGTHPLIRALQEVAASREADIDAAAEREVRRAEQRRNSRGFRDTARRCRHQGRCHRG